jgi:hypothetical protein
VKGLTGSGWIQVEGDQQRAKEDSLLEKKLAFISQPCKARMAEAGNVVSAASVARTLPLSLQRVAAELAQAASKQSNRAQADLDVFNWSWRWPGR